MSKMVLGKEKRRGGDLGVWIGQAVIVVSGT